MGAGVNPVGFAAQGKWREVILGGCPPPVHLRGRSALPTDASEGNSKDGRDYGGDRKEEAGEGGGRGGAVCCDPGPPKAAGGAGS